MVEKKIGYRHYERHAEHHRINCMVNLYAFMLSIAGAALFGDGFPFYFFLVVMIFSPVLSVLHMIRWMHYEKMAYTVRRHMRRPR